LWAKSRRFRSIIPGSRARGASGPVLGTDDAEPRSLKSGTSAGPAAIALGRLVWETSGRRKVDETSQIHTAYRGAKSFVRIR
jgi:hypothetical protein